MGGSRAPAFFKAWCTFSGPDLAVWLFNPDGIEAILPVRVEDVSLCDLDSDADRLLLRRGVTSPLFLHVAACWVDWSASVSIASSFEESGLNLDALGVLAEPAPFGWVAF